MCRIITFLRGQNNPLPHWYQHPLTVHLSGSRTGIKPDSSMSSFHLRSIVTSQRLHIRSFKIAKKETSLEWSNGEQGQATYDNGSYLFAGELMIVNSKWTGIRKIRTTVLFMLVCSYINICFQFYTASFFLDTCFYIPRIWPFSWHVSLFGRSLYHLRSIISLFAKGSVNTT